MNRFHYLSISLTAFSLLVYRLTVPAAGVELVGYRTTEVVPQIEIQHFEVTIGEDEMLPAALRRRQEEEPSGPSPIR